MGQLIDLSAAALNLTRNHRANIRQGLALDQGIQKIRGFPHGTGCLAGRRMKDPVFDMPIRKDQNNKRAVMSQTDKFDMLNRGLVLGRQNKRCALRHTGKRRTDTIKRTGHVIRIAAQCGVDHLAIRRFQVSDLKQAVNKHAQAMLRRYAAGRNMRAAQKAKILQILHHVANRGCTDLLGHVACQGPGAHGTASRQVGLDNTPKHLARAIVHFTQDVRSVIHGCSVSREAPLKTACEKGQSGLLSLRGRLYPKAEQKGSSCMRPSGRDLSEMRPVSMETGVTKHAEGSCMIRIGDTHVLCTATLEDRVPPFIKGSGLGWVTAEYGMLPRSTTSRMRREATAGKQGGRTVEIQRLIGRSLRAGVDRVALGDRQITVDCDVIQADGGTRCASITGGWIALRLAVNKLMKAGDVISDPLVDPVAAVSCGIYAGQPVLDLDYPEDSEAGVDGNFIMTGSKRLIEVQMSAEGSTYSRDQMNQLMDLAEKGVTELVAAQKAAVNA